MCAPKNTRLTVSHSFLLTHLYQYFGVLLGCSTVGTSPAFPSYMGEASQYSVHKYMALDENEVGYFITQVGLAAASFGVATDDITIVAKALTSTFDYKCSPPVTVIPAQGPQLQAICIADTCPLSPNATCASYAPVMQPLVANATLAMGEGVNSTTSATTGMMSPTITPSSGAAKFVGSFVAIAAAVVAFAL